MKAVSKTKTRYPTKIHLFSLPEQGQIFTYSRKTGELNSVLLPLIQNSDYSVEIRILPIGNAFQVSGHITTQLPVLCSYCGVELNHNVNLSINEIIVIEEERPRTGRSNHNAAELLSSGPYCNYVNRSDFDLSLFIQELIAAEEPYIVSCNQAQCSDRLKMAQSLSTPDQDTENQFKTANNPFLALKGLDIKGLKS